MQFCLYLLNFIRSLPALLDPLSSSSSYFTCPEIMINTLLDKSKIVVITVLVRLRSMMRNYPSSVVLQHKGFVF